MRVILETLRFTCINHPCYSITRSQIINLTVAAESLSKDNLLSCFLRVSTMMVIENTCTCIRRRLVTPSVRACKVHHPGVSVLMSQIWTRALCPSAVPGATCCFFFFIIEFSDPSRVNHLQKHDNNIYSATTTELIAITNMQSRFQFFPSILASLALAALLQILEPNPTTIEAIKCYVCQSNIDPKCADPFDNLTLPITDCDAYPRADLVAKSEYDLVEEKSFFLSFGQQPTARPLRATMCRKIRQKVNGEWRTIRGCGYLGAPGNSAPESSETNNCHIRHGNYDIFMESCACNSKDGCNASIGKLDIGASHLILLLSSLATTMLYFISNLNNHHHQ